MPRDDPTDNTRARPFVSPAHMMPVQVIRREIPAPQVVTLFLVLPGTHQAPAPYLPGQFVTLALPTTHETLYRSYSLCSAGDLDQPWEITIKRLHQGAVSTYMYDSVSENTLLFASLPRGSFTLPACWSIRTPFVFVAAGSGITPIIGMLRYLASLPAEERPRVQLHYASRTEEDIIYRRELEQMDPSESWLRQWHYLSSRNIRMTADLVLSHAEHVAPLAHWYMCGPVTLKRDLQALLADAGVPEDHIHAEVFATEIGVAHAQVGAVYTTGGTAPTRSSAARLRVADTGDVLDVRESETLLATLERHGYRPDFSCRAGACGACRVKLLSGQVAPIGEALSTAERAEGYILSCIARPQDDVTIATGGRPPATRVRASGTAEAVPSVARQAARMLVRMTSLVAVGGLMLGTWNLTNHKPLSWQQHAASSPGTGSSPPPTQPSAGHTPTAPGSTATPVPAPPPPVATARPSPPPP